MLQGRRSNISLQKKSATVKTRFPSSSLRISQNEFVSHPVSGSRGQEIPRTLPPPSQHALTQSFHPPSNSYGPTSILACVMQPARRHGFRAATAASSACATHEKPRGGETGDGGRPPARQSPSSLLWSLAHSLSPLISICNLSAVGGRSHCNKLPRRPRRWTTPPPVQPPPILTNSDNLTPDSDLVSQNLRQQRPAAERGGGPVLLRPHSLNLSTYLPPISSPPLI